VKKTLQLFCLFFLAVSISACVKDRVLPSDASTGPIDPGNRELIHYWNFNNNSSFNALITPTFTIGGAELDYTAVWDEVGDGSELNVRDNDIAGSALRLRNPAGDFFIKVPTTGYRDVLLSFAVMRTGNGAQENLLSYSTDGVNFIATGLSPRINAVTEEFSLQTYDFSSIAVANNNPDFVIKISFNLGNNNPSGNNRFDNITIDANPIGGSGGGGGGDPSGEIELLHYWNFNDVQNLLTPTQTEGGAELLYDGNAFDEAPDGSTLNLQNEDEAGFALRLRNAANSLTITAPSINYRNISVNFAIKRNAFGPQILTFEYTVDGINFISTNITPSNFAVTENYELVSISLEDITEVNNNQNLKIRILFSDGNTSPVGQTRIDNLTVTGLAL
jgi:hypothetical protein